MFLIRTFQLGDMAPGLRLETKKKNHCRWLYTGRYSGFFWPDFNLIYRTYSSLKKYKTYSQHENLSYPEDKNTYEAIRDRCPKL
jgi:hypothetical protein